MASDAERVYADVWADSQEKQRGRSEESQVCVISTTTPRLLIRAAADPARFRVGDVRNMEPGRVES